MSAPIDLFKTAQRLVWWDSPENAVQDRLRLVAQVMVFGNWEDVQAVRRTWGKNVFAEVLRNAPAGIFDARSWAYWHNVCRIHPLPPLPRREYAEL